MDIKWGLFKNGKLIGIFDEAQELKEGEKGMWGEVGALRRLLKWDDKGWHYTDEGWIKNAEA